MFRVPCDRVNSLSWVRSSRAPVSCDAPRLTARKRSTAQAASAIQPPFRLSNPRIIGTPSNRFAPLDGDGGPEQEQCDQDRKSVVEGKRVSVSVDLGGRRIMKKQNNKQKH